MGSETTAKTVRLSRSFRTKAVAGLIIGMVMATCYKVLQKQSPVQTQSVKMEDGNPVYIKLPSDDLAPLDLSKFSNCTRAAPSEPRPKEEWSQPIWFATPNFSLSDSVHKDLINQLTGLAQGGKSFYASVKGQLRHCVGNTETATCTISSAPNEKLFYSKYFLVLRNPKGLFPFAANSKGILYHGLNGQTPIEKWRQLRDVYIEKMMDEWVSDIKDWMQADYDIGLYIVYEDLMHVKKGPDVVRKIAGVLREAGFNVVDEDHIPCVWYNSIGEEKIQQYHKYNYDFEDYIPGFTKGQQKLMISSLNNFIEDVKDTDKELAQILETYVNDIRTGTTIDQKWENKTLSDE